MSNPDEEVRDVVEVADMLRSSASSSSVSTEPANSQSHGASLRRDGVDENEDGREPSPADRGEDEAVDSESGAGSEERVLHAWFNVPVRIGEVTGPEGTSTIQDPWAFVNCILTWILLASVRVDASGLIKNATQDVRDAAAAALNERGRIVTFVWDLQTGSGTLFHPRGRLALDNQNDILEMLVDWVVEPSVTTRRMRVDGQLPFDFGDISKTAERAAWRDRLGPLQDTHAVSFLRTMDVFPAAVQADVEAIGFINSHDNRDAPMTVVSRMHVTVIRDDKGRFRGMTPIEAANVHMNYTTVNQDSVYGMWAEVEPFSTVGARAVLEALRYPSVWAGRRPVIVEIAPAWEPLPAEVLMENAQVIDPWKPEDIRTAFHLVQSVARAKAAQREPGAALDPPCVTIVVTAKER